MNCLQFRDVLWPGAKPEAVLELLLEPLVLQVVLGEVVDGAVAFGPDLQIDQFSVDGAAGVGRQGPRRCRPNQQVLVVTVPDREPDEHGGVHGEFPPLGNLHVGIGTTRPAGPRHQFLRGKPVQANGIKRIFQIVYIYEP